MEGWKAGRRAWLGTSASSRLLCSCLLPLPSVPFVGSATVQSTGDSPWTEVLGGTPLRDTGCRDRGVQSRAGGPGRGWDGWTDRGKSWTPDRGHQGRSGVLRAAGLCVRAGQAGARCLRLGLARVGGAQGREAAAWLSPAPHPGLPSPACPASSPSSALPSSVCLSFPLSPALCLCLSLPLCLSHLTLYPCVSRCLCVSVSLSGFRSWPSCSTGSPPPTGILSGSVVLDSSLLAGLGWGTRSCDAALSSPSLTWGRPREEATGAALSPAGPAVRLRCRDAAHSHPWAKSLPPISQSLPHPLLRPPSLREARASPS